MIEKMRLKRYFLVQNLLKKQNRVSPFLCSKKMLHFSKFRFQIFLKISQNLFVFEEILIFFFDQSFKSRKMGYLAVSVATVLLFFVHVNALVKIEGHWYDLHKDLYFVNRLDYFLKEISMVQDPSRDCVGECSQVSCRLMIFTTDQTTAFAGRIVHWIHVVRATEKMLLEERWRSCC